MGRKPKPVEDHIRGGTYRPDRHGPQDAMPKLPAFGSQPPSELDAWGVRVWNETYPVLAGRGVLTEGDRGTFVAYCDALGTLLHAMDEIKKTGLVREEVTPAEEGKPEKKKMILSAWYDIKRNAFADAMRSAAMLGLTPTDRARVVKSGDLSADTGKPEPVRKSLLSGATGPLKIRIAGSEDDEE